MKKYIENFLNNFLDIFIKKIENADAIFIGIGSGMSTASGLDYSGDRFELYFSDFQKKYGIQDMYSGGFYPYKTYEEYWAWWSRHVLYNRYECHVGKPYLDLFDFVKEKNYFVLTTNVDHQVQRAGFDKNRLFYMQGDYGLFQCLTPCHKKTYDNEELIRKMVAEQNNMKIPSSLIPYCPICKKHMTMNLRVDDSFVEDEGWHMAKDRYINFVHEYSKKENTVFLELGVGNNTPGIIKYPFMQMAIQNLTSCYISINMQDFYIPDKLENRSFSFVGDIKKVLENI